jgi:hypothetical protein
MSPKKEIVFHAAACNKLAPLCYVADLYTNPKTLSHLRTSGNVDRPPCVTTTFMIVFKDQNCCSLCPGMARSIKIYLLLAPCGADCIHLYPSECVSR